MLLGVLGSSLLQKFEICKPLMNSMDLKMFISSYFAFRYSQLHLISPLSCNCKCASQVHIPSVLLNSTSRSLFYYINNSHSAAAQNCTDNAVYLQLLTDIVNLWLGDERGHNFAHFMHYIIRNKVMDWRFWIWIQAQFDYCHLPQSATDQPQHDGTYCQARGSGSGEASKFPMDLCI